MTSAARTTVKAASNLHAVAYDLATTMRTGRSQRMDRAFETVKDVSLARLPDFKRFIVVIPAYLAFGHHQFSDPR
jgi:hypothetical protein